MTRLFISHSGVDREKTIALQTWLTSTEGGCARRNEIYLDFDDKHGIAGGHKWCTQIETAVTRCEAVIFLVSETWINSDWCKHEFEKTRSLNKRFFCVLLENIAEHLLPIATHAQWQRIPLFVEGGDNESIVAVDERTNVQTPILFPKYGLNILRAGLKLAGIGTDNFPLVEDQKGPHGWRAPYRGLKPFEEEDAGVFFGRSADIVRGLDALRGFRVQARPRLVAILGASGAGKSSFLRAGILPRLKRDDAIWLPLRPVRKGSEGAIEGDEGLLQVLAMAYKDIGEPRNPADIREALRQEDSFVSLITDLRTSAASRAASNELPLVILSIDQTEELFAADGADATHFLQLTRKGMDAGALLVLATIRSDAFEKLQNAKVFAGLHKDTISLEAVPEGEIAGIIREPALRLRAMVPKAPAFSEEVVVELQSEIHGEEDALPLLAFAMERLMKEYQAESTIKLEHLQAKGGVASAIDAEGERAMNLAHTPVDPLERREALRSAFVPHLVRIDLDSKTIRRGVAHVRDIPKESRALVDALTKCRLLVVKGEGEASTVEVAHEALLRRWATLAPLIEEEAGALQALDEALRAAREWWPDRDTPKGPHLLKHSGPLLDDAKRLANKGAEWAKRIERAAESGAPLIEYLVACIAKQEKRLLDEKASDESFLDRQRRLAGVVEERISERRYDSAMRIALAGEVDDESIKRGYSDDPLRRASLARAAYSCRLLRILEPHPDAIPCLAFSPDSRRLVTGCHDGWARLFDADTGEKLYHDQLHFQHRRAEKESPGWINGIAFMPNGAQIVTGGRDGIIAIWEPEASHTYRLGPTDHEVRCIAIHPSGRTIAAGCSDGCVEIWDVAKRWRKHKLKRHDGAVLSIAYSGDGQYLVTGGKDGNKNEQGKVIVGRGKRKARPWESELLDGEIHGVAFSPDGLHFAAASYVGVGRIWDRQTGSLRFELQGHSRQIRSITFSRDGLRLATSSGDETVRLWDARTGRPLSQLSGHDGWVQSVAFNGNGSRIASGGFDRTARIWDTGSSSEIAKFALPGVFGRIAISPDGSLLAAGSDSEREREPGEPVRIWRTESMAECQILPNETVGAKRLQFSADGQHLEILDRNGVLSSWHIMKRTKRTCLAGMPAKAEMVAIDGAGTLAAVARDERIIEILDRASGRIVAGPFVHPGKVSDLAFSPTGSILASAGSTVTDGSICIWAIDHRNQQLGPAITAHKGMVLRIAFSPNGRRIISAGADRRSCVWDVDTQQKVDELYGHTDQVMDVCYNSDGTRLATACRDRLVRVFDTADHRGLSAFPVSEQVTAVVFHPSGRFLAAAAAGVRGAVHIWDSVFVSALTGQRLLYAVAAHRLEGAENLSEKEAADLSKVGGSNDSAGLNVAEKVVALEIGVTDAVLQGTQEVLDVWRKQRQMAYDLETRLLAPRGEGERPADHRGQSTWWSGMIIVSTLLLAAFAVAIGYYVNGLGLPW